MGWLVCQKPSNQPRLADSTFLTFLPLLCLLSDTHTYNNHRHLNVPTNPPLLSSPLKIKCFLGMYLNPPAAPTNHNQCAISLAPHRVLRGQHTLQQQWDYINASTQKICASPFIFFVPKYAKYKYLTRRRGKPYNFPLHSSNIPPSGHSCCRKTITATRKSRRKRRHANHHTILLFYQTDRTSETTYATYSEDTWNNLPIGYIHTSSGEKKKKNVCLDEKQKKKYATRTRQKISLRGRNTLFACFPCSAQKALFQLRMPHVTQR